MRRTLSAALVILLFTLSLVSFSTLAQDETPEERRPLPVEGGFKVPLSIFISALATDQLRIEAAAALPGFSAPLVDFEAQLTARYYLPIDLTAGPLPMEPYVGGGGLFISSLGQAVPGFIGVIGSDFIPSNIPLIVFFEGMGILPMTQGSTSVVLSFSIGARYAWGRN